jgi:hypothetical protein
MRCETTGYFINWMRNLKEEINQLEAHTKMQNIGNFFRSFDDCKKGH